MTEKTEELSGLSVEDREESVAEKQKETIQQLNEKQKQAAETIAHAELLLQAGPGTGNKDFDFPDSVFTGRER